MKLTDLKLQHVLFVTMLFTLISTVSAKTCYICNSTLDRNCQEMFDHDSITAFQKVKECDMWDAKYCVKVTGLWGGVVGAHRFCSSRDLGMQCQDVSFPDHDRMYRACVYTCSDDNCNLASRMSLTAVSIVFTGWLFHHLLQVV